MRVLLIGFPVCHSLSPRFQNAAFKACSLDHSYEVHPVEIFRADDVRELLHGPDVLGANVTVPHKRAVVECVDHLTETARLVGAVNAVFRRRQPDGTDELVGDNTDVGGFLAALWAGGAPRALETVVVLGAGGAARAVIVALRPLCREIIIINRTLDRAARLTDDLRERAPGEALLSPWEWPHEGTVAHHLDSCFSQAQLVVDATSLGLGHRPGTAEFAAARAALGRLPFELMPDSAVLHDLKYGARTPFLVLAERTGRPHHDGLAMLVAQGALGFERWTGLPAPITAMRESVGLSGAHNGQTG